MKIRVNTVQRFCLHDGPGIRTTVFLQGCPLQCWWCHNPETQPIHSPSARDVGVVDLVTELERDAHYWSRSGGGVTLSGGEPLAQADAVEALVTQLSERGRRSAIDTSGQGDPAAVSKISGHVDLWLWDIKTLDPARYREGTGADLAPALENLAWVLTNTETEVVVRIPLIADFNTSADDFATTASWLNAQPRPVSIELLPGHSHGVRPGRRPKVTVAAADVRRAARTLGEAGLRVIGQEADE